MSETVTEIAIDDLDIMTRQMNKALMVAFINADLVSRARLDVERSVVFYDAAHEFAFAMDELPDQEALDRLAAKTRIRHWARGV